jgi:hypothetical protein
MAQAGFTPLLIYGSGTTGNTPLAGNLTNSVAGAELALNYFDGKLFYKDASNVVQVLATKSTGTIGGSNTQVQYNSSGSLAGSANLTFDGTTLTAANFADSSLTSGRVTYAGAAGNLTDSTNLTFNGTTLTANTLNLTNALTTAFGGTGLTSYTAGDLPYYAAGTALTKLGIGSSTFILTSSGSAPQWSNPTGITVGTATNAVNTGITANSTNATNYLTFVSNTTGNLPQLVNSSISCNPSTGSITGGITAGTF